MNNTVKVGEQEIVTKSELFIMVKAESFFLSGLPSPRHTVGGRWMR